MKRILVLPFVALALTLLPLTQAHADTDDFEFTSFTAEYELSRADDGTSQLTTTEVLVAQFPDFDQNHGIERALVDTYDGHPTDLEVRSVTDGEGNSLTWEEDDGVVRIGDEDRYVRGSQTYVITYTERNITRYFANTDAQEFYRDTNGTDWAQPFGQVTATLEIAPDLVDALTGEADAGAGSEGNDDVPAEITLEGGTATATAGPLGPGQNLSFSVGFEPGTFAERPSGFFDSAAPTVSAIGLLLALIGLGIGVRLRLTSLRDAPGRGTVIAQYEAPEGVELGLSAVILSRTTKITAATILDLAVRGYLRIVEDSSKRKPSFALEFITDEGADRYSRDFLHALFGATLTPGEDRELTKNDENAAKRIAAVVKTATGQASERGYRAPYPTAAAVLAVVIAVIGVGVAFFSGVYSLAQSYGGPAGGIAIAGSLVAAIAAIILIAKYPLTREGTLLREHLAGLGLYIDLAEKDRLKVLQSPEGAERSPVATYDARAVVKLNERLLPYASLFGSEKRWAEELGKYYQDIGERPEWYAGSAGFNAAYFAATVGSVTTSAATAYSTSTDGSGGGVSSGGGSGGGGGGGW